MRSIQVWHRFIPGLGFKIGANTQWAIQSVAAIMTHEKKHISNHNKLTSPGEKDTDGDGLADSEENKAPYFFVIDSRDTYNLGFYLRWGIYRRYGDDEFTTRMAEQGGVEKAKLKEDWSKGGAQWRFSQ